MTTRTNRKWLIFLTLVTILLLIVIYIQSAQPPPKIFGEIAGLDKAAHFAAYSVLGVMILTILNITGHKKMPALSLSLFLVLLAGMFDELHQYYVPQRNPDAWDLLADFFGGLFAVFVLSRFKKKGKLNHVST